MSCLRYFYKKKKPLRVRFESLNVNTITTLARQSDWNSFDFIRIQLGFGFSFLQMKISVLFRVI